MKRVIIASDGVTVANVAKLSGQSPAGVGVFVDVADNIQVAPFWTWNGSTSSPVFAFGMAPFVPTIESRMAAAEASIPSPADMMPPAVGDSSSLGTDTKYALANHTHASRARKRKITMPSAASTYTWTYSDKDGNALPFPVGVIPVVSCIVQVAAGNTDLYNVQVLGEPTRTSCVFQINRVSSGLLALLTGALSVNPTPIAATLHMIALEP